MQNEYTEYNEEQEIKLTDYLHILLRYKWLIVLIFLAVFISSTIYTAKAPRIYQGTSKILIEDKMSSNLLFSDISSNNSSINNNIAILKSRPVLDIAHQLLKKVENYNDFPVSNTVSPIGYIGRVMSVVSERDSDILTISVESTNPLEAKEIANSLAKALSQLNTEHARVEFRNTREFIANQLEEVERRLRGSEEDLRNYKIEHDISQLSSETEELITQSSQLEAQLSGARTEFDVAIKHLSFLERELTKQDSLLVDVNSVLTSPLLEQLREEIILNQTRYFNLLTKSEYSSEHPELVTLNRKIESGKSKLATEIQKITAVTEGASDPLAYRARLTEEISDAKIELNLKESKVVGLQEAVDQYSRRMSILPDTEIELARLEREYMINQNIYSIFAEKYEDAKVAEKSKLGNVRQVEEAQLPGAPIKPNRRTNMMIALVLGLGLGVGAALLVHSLDSKIRTFDDVKQYVSLPILGTVPYIYTSDADVENIEKLIPDSDSDQQKKLQSYKEQVGSKLITNYSPKSSAAEAFRMLRTNIVTRKVPGKTLTMLISSSGPKEGKSTIISNMAIALAQMDAKVVLVDLDLRRPMQHNIFSVDKENGVSDFLVDKKADLGSLIFKTEVPNLDLVTSGFIPPNPSELLASKRMDEALAYLKANYDYVLLDSPPVIAVTDSMVLANKVDILSLVVRIGKSDKAVVRRSRELFESINAPITGAIINGIHPHKYYNTYEYNYYYLYYYGKERGKS